MFALATRMHWIGTLALVFVWHVVTPPSAHAQAPQGLYLDLQGGYGALDTYGLSNVDDAFVWQAGVGFELANRVSLRVIYQQSRTTSIIDEDVHLRSFLVQPRYHILDRRFSPFVSILAGYQWTDLAQIDDFGSFVYGGSIGAIHTFDDTISTFVDLSLQMHDLGNPINETQINVLFMIGARLHFGSRAGKVSSVPAKRSADQDSNPAGLLEPQVCQDVPAGVPVDAFGCPLDFDNDRVPDHLDRCPGSATQEVDSMGCPRIHFARGVIEEIRFETGSARLTKSSVRFLSRVATELKRFPDLYFVVEGHTDGLGKASDNMALSKARATTVVNVLVQNGVDLSQLSAIGYGQQYPLAPNDTERGRALNRRVEIKWQAKP